MMRLAKLRTVKIVGLLLIGLGLNACSVDGSISDITLKVLNPTMAPMAGLISGGYQNGSTASGYKVSASVGSPYSEPSLNKTSSGYTVYSSVQGGLYSETYRVIRH